MVVTWWIVAFFPVLRCEINNDKTTTLFGMHYIPIDVEQFLQNTMLQANEKCNLFCRSATIKRYVLFYRLQNNCLHLCYYHSLYFSFYNDSYWISICPMALFVLFHWWKTTCKVKVIYTCTCTKVKLLLSFSYQKIYKTAQLPLCWNSLLYRQLLQGEFSCFLQLMTYVTYDVCR